MRKALISTVGLLILFISISVHCAVATPIYYEANGHYYDAVPADEPGITWGEANIAAQASSYEGMNGHLATITSQDENNFIVSNLGGQGYWLGGFQPEGSPEPDGGWQWVTGEPWEYTNWPMGIEPNNHYGGDETHPVGWPEDALQIRDYYMWNDYPDDVPMYGYIVEYENDQTPELIAAFSASSISGYAPLKVQFIDTSTGSATAWKWDFGDGKSSAHENPKHTYSKPGKYTVSLTVENAAGTDTETRSEYIVVSKK